MYQQKEFMTESEQYFYNILKEIETEYDVKIQPQINLASIIEKQQNTNMLMNYLETLTLVYLIKIIANFY